MNPSRFVSEFGLNMFASGVVLLQDDDLNRLPEIVGGDDPEFHLYAITARPRIAINPTKFAFNDAGIQGNFVVHDGPRSLEFPFEVAHPPQGRVTSVESTWPHTSFRLLSGTENVLRGKAAILAAMVCRGMQSHLDLEVLYIGQAYGEAGERQAPARLQDHSTLQTILSEASRLQPDREVWLVLFHLEQLSLTSFDGRLANSDADALAADEGRLERFLASEISEQQRINFTEGALIRYFEPRFNKVFRKNFPSPKHATYRQCYDIDLNMIAAELDTEPIRARLYSGKQPASWHHHAMFPLHDRTERVYMIDLLMPGGPKRG